MRFTQIFSVFTTTILLLCSCEHWKTTVYLDLIYVNSEARCTYHEQNVEIKFNRAITEQIEISAKENVSWITNITTNNKDSIIISVTENSGNERTGSIVLTAPGYYNKTIKLTQNGAPKQAATHTLMYYFFGTSLGRYFNENIADAKLAISKDILGDNNRVIYFRQKSEKEAYIAEICYDRDKHTCYESIIENNIIIEGNPISDEYITGVINKMAAAAPAERYGLVMAGHGYAWLSREAVMAGNDISQLSLSHPLFIPAEGAEITRALGEKNVLVSPSVIAQGICNSYADIDYIIFDACMMANIENIYELRNTANYIIASPCEIMGRGFPYERTLPHLFRENGTSTDYDAAAKSYYLYYRDEYNKNERSGSIALFDCSEIEALRDATIEIVKSARIEYDSNALQTYEGQKHHYFYDFGQWANTVATDEVALQNFNTQLNNTVIAKYSLDTFYSAYGSFGIHDIDLEVYSGVTTSAPSDILNKLWKSTEWYKDVWQL